MLGMPRFTTAGIKDATLSLNVFNTFELPRITIYGESYGTDRIEVGVLEVPDEYGLTECSIVLPESLLGKEWVQLYIEVSFESPSSFLYVDEISVDGTEDSSVETMLSHHLISGGEGYISIVSDSEEEYSIYNVDGFLTARGFTESPVTTIQATPGIYVVRLGETVRKVSVR